MAHEKEDCQTGVQSLFPLGRASQETFRLFYCSVNNLFKMTKFVKWPYQ